MRKVYSCLKIMNVKYILSPNKLSKRQEDIMSLNRVSSGKYYNNFQYKDAHLYEYMKSEPRAQFLKKLSYLKSSNEGYKHLNNENFINNEDSFIIDQDSTSSNKDFSYHKESSLIIKKWSPNEIIIETDVYGEDNHFVLLSEVFFPYGWDVQGSIDNEIVEVNNFIRGFFVSEGKNEVIITFNPKDIKYGSILTYISFLLILIMIFSPMRRLVDERV